ncbi:MAG: Gfo/Idh/MocA family oxidoreductase [Opitutae bacterium]|jgi:predicted dehydrogenase|nr:Gfo/Idh/MocA family oxidoreductase [Opitutae bacterium]MBT4223295.1 Gfo/Idh/MocA family oxidoreductase [Opitutae bacterium]MBT5692280.1 Gfo/Idh/MocA family oxidoreductase [Opitutae bacterium]MBT6463856.1 Gfo/Idh/MocA family oxidoreductase [Opitutae bacterium]MBT6958500.1 Gfo/Idh/MocA family oxidoreductase [Opitutae bacterium]
MKSTTRRNILKQLTATGIIMPYVAKTSWAQNPPSNTLRHASFGGGGMAMSDLTTISSAPNVQLVATVEIDQDRRNSFKNRFNNTRVYADWREMLDKEAKNLDSVNVSTPDHMHAPMAMSAMQLGKHVYGQKPLTHEIYECRQVQNFAREKKLVTQMGIQIHSHIFYRTAVRIVQDGVIGKIKEVHTWSNKKWGDMGPKPNRKDTVPKGLNWDQWIGPAPYTDYLKGYYHPGNWRRRLDYGTGTFGDMGCHIYDPVFKALDLTSPLSLKSTGPKPNSHNWAINAEIRYTFPSTKFSDGKTVDVTWYDGDKRPPGDIQARLDGKRIPGQGSIFIGTKGVMLLPHVGKPELFPKKDFADYKPPELPKINHWDQFVDACRGKGGTSANFDYAGPLTETVLLGGVATRFPDKELDWDTEKLEFTNEKNAAQYVRREYRKGWEVEGL